MSILVIVSVATASFLIADDTSNFTLAELVEGNQQALDSIEGIELEMHHSIARFKSGAPFEAERKIPVWRWAKKDSVERIRFDDGRQPNQQGQPESLYDWFADGKSIKILRNWDPKNPQKIVPMDQGTVRAEVRPPSRKPLGRDAPRFLLWTFNDGSDDRRTLAELVAESPKAELIGRDQVEGHPAWHLRIEHPPIDGKEMPGRHFDVFVCPQNNFMVRRVIEHYPALQKPIDNAMETYDLVITRTAKEFKEFANAVFVPVDIETREVTTTSDRREQVTRTRIENLVVNAPLSEDALNFVFPENVLVMYEPPIDPSSRRVVLWGPDNKPAKEISAPTDIPGYQESRTGVGPPAAGVPASASPPSPSSQRHSSMLIWLNLGALVLIAVYVVARRAIRNRRGS